MSIFQTGWDLRYVITPNDRWDPDSHDFQWKYKYMSYTGSVSSKAGSSSNATGPSSSTAGPSSTPSSIKPTWWTGEGFAEKFRERKLPHSQLAQSDTNSEDDDDVAPELEADIDDDDDGNTLGLEVNIGDDDDDAPEFEADIGDDDDDAPEFEADIGDDDDDASEFEADIDDDDDDAPELLDPSEYTFTVGELPDKDVGDTLVGQYYFKVYVMHSE